MYFHMQVQMGHGHFSILPLICTSTNILGLTQYKHLNLLDEVPGGLDGCPFDIFVFSTSFDFSPIPVSSSVCGQSGISFSNAVVCKHLVLEGVEGEEVKNTQVLVVL